MILIRVLMVSSFVKLQEYFFEVQSFYSYECGQFRSDTLDLFVAQTIDRQGGACPVYSAVDYVIHRQRIRQVLIRLEVDSLDPFLQG